VELIGIRSFRHTSWRIRQAVWRTILLSSTKIKFTTSKFYFVLKRALKTATSGLVSKVPPRVLKNWT